MVHRLPENLALALPFPPLARERAVRLLRQPDRILEVRIGVGPVDEPPIRVLGHARCLTRALTDLRGFLRADSFYIFSTSPKIAHLAGTDCPPSHIRALAALAGALRIAGYGGDIFVEEAEADREIAADIAEKVDLPTKLEAFLEHAAAQNANGANPRAYAIEHAAPSMFGDIDVPGPERLRLTLGAKPEARFWAVRQRVAAAAEDIGLAIIPSVGLILRTLSRPWYSTTAAEPPLSALLTSSPDEVAMLLDRAANIKYGGNPGLQREARNTVQAIYGQEASALASATSTVGSAGVFLRAGFRVGLRLQKRINEVLK